MTQNLYKLYFYACRRWMKNASLVNALVFKVVSLITQFWLNGVYRHLLKKGRNKLHPRQSGEEVIVSLTTFPARISTVWITIETIFRQEVMPNRIVLWLAKEQFPFRGGQIPDTLKNQVARGLEIRFCEDLKSHKKYYYSMKENPESVVITIDDDVFYPKDMVKNLLLLHEKHPKDVIATSAQEIPDNFFEVPSKWKSPHFNHINDKFAKCRILGISGILYPPHSLHPDVFNDELRMKLCPWADDLWLTIMAYINGTQIRRYEFRSNPLDIKGTQAFNLSRGGDMGNAVTHGLTNDDQWRNLTVYYRDIIFSIINSKRQ